MPVIPTASDGAYLRTLAQATDIAHRRFGMKVILTLTANCMGNDKAGNYELALLSRVFAGKFFDFQANCRFFIEFPTVNR